MHGPLSEIGLVEVMQLLERGRRTGVLHVVGADPSAPRTLFLVRGRVAAVEPDAGDAALHRALVAVHLAAPGDRFEAVPSALREATRVRLAVRTLATLLHWTRGRFDFEERDVAPGPMALSIDQLILDMVAAEGRRVDLAAAMRDFHAVPEFASVDRVASGPAPTLTPLDWRVLDAVDGVRDVGAMAAHLDEPLEDVAERVQALEAAAILVLRAAPANIAVEARAALEAGRYEDAARLLRGRVAAVPHDAEAWRALGLAEVGAGRFDRAIEAWQAWQTADPARAADAASLMQAARTMLEALVDARD
jgi:tetratricopeptide (TPR) repeat protein